MYIPVSRAVIPHLQYTHHTGTRTGTFYKEAEDSEDVAALSDAFSDASGDLGTLDCIYGMWAILISALITFSIQKQRLLLKIWAHSRKMVICSSQHLMMQMQPFRNDCIGPPPLDNRVLCSCRHSYLMVGMVVRH